METLKDQQDTHRSESTFENRTVLPIFSPYGLILGLSSGGWSNLDEPLMHSVFGPEPPIEEFTPEGHPQISDTVARQLHPFLFLRVKKGVFRCYDETLYHIVLKLNGTVLKADNGRSSIREIFGTISQRLMLEVYGEPEDNIDDLTAKKGETLYSRWTFGDIFIRLFYDPSRKLLALEFKSLKKAQTIEKERVSVPDIYSYFAPETPAQKREYEESYGKEMDYEEYFKMIEREEQCEKKGKASAPILYDDLKTLIDLAKSGDPESQFALGAVYEDASGVKKDLKKAVHWYTLAAAQNNADAQLSLAKIYEKGPVKLVNPAKALKLFKQAAEQGEVEAANRLVKVYRSGQLGQPVNKEKSNYYKHLAAKQK